MLPSEDATDHAPEEEGPLYLVERFRRPAVLEKIQYDDLKREVGVKADARREIAHELATSLTFSVPNEAVINFHHVDREIRSYDHVIVEENFFHLFAC